VLIADCYVFKDRPTTAFPHYEKNSLIYHLFAPESRGKMRGRLSSDLSNPESPVYSLLTVMSNEPAQLIGFSGAELEKMQAVR